MKNTPLGIRDFLPTEVKTRFNIISAIETHLQSAGFERIITPTIENYDLIKDALGSDLNDRCILFFDHTGARLALRPDPTAAIARIAGSRLSDQLPLKLYYHDPIFRKDKSLGESEIFQLGCEHIGTITTKNEADMIQHAITIATSIGIADIEVHISHTDLCSNLNDTEITNLKNGIFTDQAELPNKTPLNETSHPLFTDLSTHLSSNNVFINHSLYKDPSYYNGIYFDIVSPSYGKVLGSGGRYDHVLNTFKLNSNACGFAYNMHHLEKAQS
jgi:ATP phosphoribosyltransferase regulatory subunit